jgi:hypothetical protein
MPRPAGTGHQLRLPCSIAAPLRRAFIWDPLEDGLAYNYTIESLRKRWNNLLSEHLEPLWPEDVMDEEAVEAQKYQSELKSTGRRRQLLPVQQGSGSDGGEQQGPPPGWLRGWADGAGCLRGCLQRLWRWLLGLMGWGEAGVAVEQVVGGGAGLPSQVWAVADSRQRHSLWLEGGRVVPWFWRSGEGAADAQSR